MWESITTENTESLVSIFDTERPLVSTGEPKSLASSDGKIHGAAAHTRVL
jgi:hypothetical protein